MLFLSQNTCVLSGSKPIFDVPFLNPCGAQNGTHYTHGLPGNPQRVTYKGTNGRQVCLAIRIHVNLTKLLSTKHTDLRNVFVFFSSILIPTEQLAVTKKKVSVYPSAAYREVGVATCTCTRGPRKGHYTLARVSFLDT